MVHFNSQPCVDTGARRVDVSVITPSFNMLSHLQRCCASVADQANVSIEHIVMDGGSTDDTAEWLRRQPSLISDARRDNGMYDAVNKGFRIARGDIISHLNCDEQYLPGTLQYVLEYFRKHPEVDVLFGNVLTVRPDGSLIAFRKVYCPFEAALLSSPLPVFTAAMFLRRQVIDDGQIYDDSYKDIGDVEFVLRLIRNGYRFGHLRRYLSTFTITGYNRSAHVTTIPDEVKRLQQQAPWWIRRFQPVWRSLGRGTKFVNGAYFQRRPIKYAIYGGSEPVGRTDFQAQNPSFKWS